MSKGMRVSDWGRALRLVFGLVGILASVLVLLLPGLAVVTLLLVLSLALFFLGVGRIAHGFAAKGWTKLHRVVHAAGGVLALILSAAAVAFPSLGVSTLIFLLALGLLCYGIASLVIGGIAKLLPKYVRALLVIVGVVSIIFSLVVFALPAIGLLTLILWLSVSLLVNGGIESIASAMSEV